MLDYYDHALGGLVIEAHVHGLPTPTVKFYKDRHLLHERNGKVMFYKDVTDKEIFQCLIVRADAAASGTYTVFAENRAGTRRFSHVVDFSTKYPLMHVPLMRHADKKNLLEEILEMVPKEVAPLVPIPGAPVAVQPPVPGEIDKSQTEVMEKVAPKPEGEVLAEVAVKLEDVANKLDEAPAAIDDEPEVSAEPHKHKHRKHRKKKSISEPKDDPNALIDDDEMGASDKENDEVEKEIESGTATPRIARKKVEEEPHEPYEQESFLLRYSKDNVWFSGQLNNQTAIEGTSIKLICAVSGPQPVLKWLKNGKPVPWSATVRNMSGDGLGQIIFDKIQRSDAATYTCSAKNSHNEATTEAIVKVIPKSTLPDETTKPMFTRVLGEFYHTVEDDLVLDTNVRAIPLPVVKWYKDGIELTAGMDPRYYFETNDGCHKLRIHKPNAKDSALYACEAVNKVGKAKISHKLIFTENARHTHPQFVFHKESFFQPTLKMVIEPEPEKPLEPGQEAPNDSLGRSGRTSGQGPSASYSSQAGMGSGGTAAGGMGTGGGGGDGNGEDNRPPNSSIPRDFEPDEPEEENNEEKPAEERPRARSPRVRRKRYEGPVPEPILIRDSVRKCSFGVALKDVTAPAGTNVKLFCAINGPGTTCKWYKNDRLIDWSQKLKNMSKDGSGAMMIEKSSADDSGIYKCVAKNNFNEANCSCKVTIFNVEEISVKPTFSRITGKDGVVKIFLNV